MTRWTIGVVATATLLASLVVALLVWVIGLGQARGGAGTPAGAGRAEAPRALDRYEWVDRERGVVRIPIERAIEVVVETEAGR